MGCSGFDQPQVVETSLYTCIRLCNLLDMNRVCCVLVKGLPRQSYPALVAASPRSTYHNVRLLVWLSWKKFHLLTSFAVQTEYGCFSLLCSCWFVFHLDSPGLVFITRSVPEGIHH